MIATFLRGDTSPIEVTLFALRDEARTGAKAFMGLRIARHRVLDRALADTFVARLALDTSYVAGGDVGCFSDNLGIRLARNGRTLDFVYNCGHVFLTDAMHGGDYVLFSNEMMTLVDDLQSKL